MGYDVIQAVLPGQYMQLIVSCEQLDKYLPTSVAAAKNVERIKSLAL